MFFGTAAPVKRVNLIAHVVRVAQNRPSVGKTRNIVKLRNIFHHIERHFFCAHKFHSGVQDRKSLCQNHKRKREFLHLLVIRRVFVRLNKDELVVERHVVVNFRVVERNPRLFSPRKRCGSSFDFFIVHLRMFRRSDNSEFYRFAPSSVMNKARLRIAECRPLDSAAHRIVEKAYFIQKRSVRHIRRFHFFRLVHTPAFSVEEDVFFYLLKCCPRFVERPHIVQTHQIEAETAQFVFRKPIAEHINNIAAHHRVFARRIFARPGIPFNTIIIAGNT